MAYATTRFLALVLAIPPLGTLACAGDTKETQTGGPPPASCPPGQTWNGQACSSSSYPAPTNSSTAPAPGPSDPPAVSPGGAAQPVDPALAPAVTGLLSTVAAAHIPPGASPAGAPMAANFGPSQVLETPLSMEPGRCYTVVAVGAPTLQNLDIRLTPTMTVPGVPPPVVAQDQTVGSTAVLGGQPNCFKWALPVPGAMKLVVAAAAGQGLAAVQVYAK